MDGFIKPAYISWIISLCRYTQALSLRIIIQDGRADLSTRDCSPGLLCLWHGHRLHRHPVPALAGVHAAFAVVGRKLHGSRRDKEGALSYLRR